MSRVGYNSTYRGEKNKKQKHVCIYFLQLWREGNLNWRYQLYMDSVLGLKQLLAVMTIQADSWYLDEEGMVEIVLRSAIPAIYYM